MKKRKKRYFIYWTNLSWGPLSKKQTKSIIEMLEEQNAYNYCLIEDSHYDKPDKLSVCCYTRDTLPKKFAKEKNDD